LWAPYSPQYGVGYSNGLREKGNWRTRRVGGSGPSGGGRLITHLPGHGGRVLSTSPPMGGLTSEGPERVGKPLNRRSVVKLRFGSLNVGTMKGRSGEIAECVGRRNLDFCYLQETKWKGQERGS